MLPLPIKAQHHDGAMVALCLPLPVATGLALAGGLPPAELHCTLVFLGKAAPLQPLAAALQEAVMRAACASPACTLFLEGYGVFPPTPSSDGLPVQHLVIGGLEVRLLRERLLAELGKIGVDDASTFPFHPHITLAYRAAAPSGMPPSGVLSCRQVTLSLGNDEFSYPLGDTTVPPETPVLPGPLPLLLRRGLVLHPGARGSRNWYRNAAGKIVYGRAARTAQEIAENDPNEQQGQGDDRQDQTDWTDRTEQPTYHLGHTTPHGPVGAVRPAQPRPSVVDQTLAPEGGAAPWRQGVSALHTPPGARLAGPPAVPPSPPGSDPDPRRLSGNLPSPDRNATRVSHLVAQSSGAAVRRLLAGDPELTKLLATQPGNDAAGRFEQFWQETMLGPWQRGEDTVALQLAALLEFELPEGGLQLPVPPDALPAWQQRERAVLPALRRALRCLYDDSQQRLRTLHVAGVSCYRPYLLQAEDPALPAWDSDEALTRQPAILDHCRLLPLSVWTPERALAERVAGSRHMPARHRYLLAGYVLADQVLALGIPFAPGGLLLLGCEGSVRVERLPG